ncbi:adenylyl-sulfate kinase [Acutalibacter intestini]|uniref:adenylyl-sulfate kinase n=1 Tax=Acutalibacter intestini TaxID=3093659 RepID=UPI002AC9EA64|nr:adenylyl-sulfate kinase [Acutalibacter sp. M00204]
MGKGTVYFFTGLAGAGKTTIGGMFYERLKAIRPEAVLIDGDKNRDKTNARTPRDYSTEARRAGAKSVLKRCGEFAEQGIDAVYCGIGMYADVRAWCRENIENYREIYIKVSMETLYRRNQKGLYSPGMKQVVGVDLPWDEPDCSDVVIENDREEAPAVLVDRLFREFGLEESL